MYRNRHVQAALLICPDVTTFASRIFTSAGLFAVSGLETCVSSAVVQGVDQPPGVARDDTTA